MRHSWWNYASGKNVARDKMSSSDVLACPGRLCVRFTPVLIRIWPLIHDLEKLELSAKAREDVVMIWTDPSWADRSRCVILDRFWLKSPCLLLSPAPWGDTHECFSSSNTPAKEAKVDMDLVVCSSGKLLWCDASWQPMASLRHVHLYKGSPSLNPSGSQTHYFGPAIVIIFASATARGNR